MKAPRFLSLLAGSLLLGCSKEPAPSTDAPSSGGNPLTAPADYGQALAKGQRLANKTVDQAAISKAIGMFYATEGRFPKDLNELVPNQVSQIPEPPQGMKFDYQPATGQFKVVPK